MSILGSHKLPDELREGFPVEWELDGSWIWVVWRKDSIVGMLMACPCHGIMQLVMIKMLPGNENYVTLLLRGFLRDCQEMGFKGWMTYFRHGANKQFKLLRIARKAGAVIMPWRIICVAGKTDDAARW